MTVFTITGTRGNLFLKIIKMRKLYKLALWALIMLGLSGCEKIKIQNEASADVFIKAIKNAEGIIVYAPLHSVFSYNTITSASVKSPDAKTMQLANYDNSGNSFFNEPQAADYLTSIPATGSYTYTVLFSDGEEKTYTNSLSSAIISPANITSLAKTANGDSVYIKWDAIANVHAYQLKITKGTSQIYYQTPFSDGSVPLKSSLKIGFLVSSLNSSGPGTYTFDLSGLLFETTAYDYLQAVSSSTKNVEL
jgi:hypothetical protein